MTLARFTPSILDAETLERLFVHRHDLLGDVLQRVRGAADGSERRHRLFVGPRGAGKTHLISLVNHRVQQAIDDGLRVQLSWLVEDPWEIESYDDLLDQILEHLGAPERDSKVSAEAAILAAAKDGPIITLVENLDQILDAVDDDGQRRLRALLENERPLLIIATSTRLSDDLLSQAQPFYGFFDTTQLAPFDVDQAADMLAAVAEYNDNPSLGELLHSATGKARLATIAHLTGGQPRVWALLGTGLTTAGIDDMIEMLLARFDDLTPYYQEQLARLAPNERKLVRRLADADRPLTVRDLAELAKLDQKSAAKTVSDLRRRGWVRKYESLLTKKLDRRLQYYELAEPLARIAFQMKASRGEPIRLVIDFLVTWFDQEALASGSDSGPGATYRLAAAGQTELPARMARWLADATSPGPAENPELVTMLEALDTSVATYAHGDATMLLRGSAPVTRVIERRLATESPTYLRLRLGRLAARAGGAHRWSKRVDDIVASAPEAERGVALLLAVEVAALDGSCAGEIESLLGQLDAAYLRLDEAAADRLASEAVSTLAGLWMDASGTTLAIAKIIDVSRLSPAGQVLFQWTVAAANMRTGSDSEAAVRTFADARSRITAEDGGDDSWIVLGLLSICTLQTLGGLLDDADKSMERLKDLLAEYSLGEKWTSLAADIERLLRAFRDLPTADPAQA